MDYLKINKKLWNTKTDIHFQSEFYDVASFLKGKDSLNKIELELLGDISNKKILHLQCHFGMDSISLARHGAKVTAIDLSDRSIEKAKELNEQAGMDVSFIQSDVFQLDEKLNEKFDIVFTSYGTIGWLPELDRWGEIISHFLKPGGKLVFVEFHPVIWMFSYDFSKVEFNYSDTEAIIEELEGTYTDRDAGIKEKSVGWNHGLALVFQALLKNQLQIEDFQEYDYSPYNCFENLVKIKPGKFQIKGMERKLPMVYSIVAIKN